MAKCREYNDDGKRTLVQQTTVPLVEPVRDVRK